MTTATLLAYVALGVMGLFLLSQLGVEIMLRIVRRGLKASDLWSQIEDQEPTNWWRRVVYYIQLEQRAPSEVSGQIRVMKFLFTSSKIALATSVILFVIGNLQGKGQF